MKIFFAVLFIAIILVIAKIKKRKTEKKEDKPSLERIMEKYHFTKKDVEDIKALESFVPNGCRSGWALSCSKRLQGSFQNNKLAVNCLYAREPGVILDVSLFLSGEKISKEKERHKGIIALLIELSKI